MPQLSVTALSQMSIGTGDQCSELSPPGSWRSWHGHSARTISHRILSAQCGMTVVHERAVSYPPNLLGVVAEPGQTRRIRDAGFQGSDDLKQQAVLNI